MKRGVNPRLSKKRRTGNTQVFGAPSEDDLTSARSTVPSSSALSTRTLPQATVPALTTLSARVFVSNLQKLARNEHVWKPTLRWLKLVPDALIPRIFGMLREASPALLSHAFIEANFLRGSSITLTNDLPGLNRRTVTAIEYVGSSLHELVLTDLEKYPDSLFASLLSKLPSLRVLVLRGCTKVGPKTAEAAAKFCPSLTVVNLNYTAVTPISLAPLLLACPRLEVLKLAAIQHWTDATFAKLLTHISQDKQTRLPCLQTLKLRETSLSDTSLHPFISLCPNLRRLDVSFTAIRHPHLIVSYIPALEKLSLTSTQVSGTDLLAVVSHLPRLKTLILGALGGGQGSSVSISNSSAMTMDDDILNSLTKVLANFQHLENMSLIGNSKIGIMSKRGAAISNFVRRVGRKCKKLNLAGIPTLCSDDLSGLLRASVEECDSPLEELILNGTNIGDEAAPYISSCPSLRTLRVVGTRLTSAGLFPIIDACTKLENLELTSCRGIGVTDRRRFFEVWEKEWRNT